ncbi:transcriptional regulator [Collimonas humicola]|uniref:transcriptional regulator n=1 Tax=Collimonas humicola TaxID=2825886 RepID=UPI001B8BB73B|nr:helix-turn-helix domain-containing protein [Collimonas humicola]
MKTSIEKACHIAGGQTSLARMLGVSPQAVQQWVARGKPPSGRCIPIENAVEMEITRFDLRPDIFGNSFQGSATGRHAIKLRKFSAFSEFCD